MSLNVISGRLELVEQFRYANSFRSDITAMLRRSSDTLRLLQRFSIGKGDADDLVALARTTEITRDVSLTIRRHIYEANDHAIGSLESLSSLLAKFDLEAPSRLALHITEAIDEEGLSRQHLEQEAEAESIVQLASENGAVNTDETGPKPIKRPTKTLGISSMSSDDDSGEIWIMKKNASKTLTRAHANLASIMAERWELTTRLRTELGSNTLSLKWTPLLGHFCHVRGKDARATPVGARSISSTKSTRTFYLQDWTTLGSRLDDAKLRIRTEEQRLFNELRKEVRAKALFTVNLTLTF